ncbi:MAG: PilZ domain-containing protein [Planctomycetota bacterium]
MTQNKIPIICDAGVFQPTYGFLSAREHELVNFATIRDAFESDAFPAMPVAIIDMDREGSACFELINRINAATPGIRFILVGDFTRTVFPENIPQVFHFVRKPFAHEKLAGVLQDALSRRHGPEKRREPRVPLELPVDLYYNEQFWRTTTRNISLHGMQAVWKDDPTLETINSDHRDGRAPITACWLYLQPAVDVAGVHDHLNISLSIRYVEKNEPSVMGFQFKDLDLDLRTRLQQVVIW